MNRKLCEICGVRPIMSAKSKMARGTSFPYCDPCQDKAEWENTHSDYGHDQINSGEWLPTDADGADSIMREMANCWICHPSLDKTEADYTPRAGTSRAGMRMTVRRTQTGREKATALAEKIGDKAAASVSTRKGVVTLRVATKLGTGFSLRWTLDGRYDYAASSATRDGKSRKVRNASEALKLIGL